jgi:glyoxylase-like metal-dependent hydrolase (beta-lactamase superfamily II)
VASFAVEAGPTLLIDPLLPAHADGLLERLDALEPKAILITIPYHARSAEELSERYGAPIHGHPAVGKRLDRTKRLKPIDGELPGGASAYPIGKPRRYETPIHLPSHKALAWGDALVTTPAGDLRLWHHDRVDDKRTRWYRERFNPTLAPLLELDLERILVTHGEPVLEHGSAALRAALEAPPWYLRG